MSAPIAVMSFNRPAFLEQVLASLKTQRGGAMDGREVHLFQDGAVNRYSAITYADAADIDKCVAVFRKAFPGGKVHRSEHNIGVCENFLRAEEYFFNDRNEDCVYFFEDDMLLSPVYLEMMDILRAYAEASPRIAYFAAYGDHYAGPEEVEERRRQLVTIDHHWGFGLLRRHWLKINAALADYYKLVAGQDYTRRNHRAIYEYYQQFGAAPRGSSQDAAKAFACDRLGLWRCRTFAPFGRYIGTTGAHMTPEAFEQLGFSKTVMLQEPIIDLDFPNEERVAAFLSEQRNLFRDVFEKELPGVMATLPSRKLNPMRLCTSEDVRAAYNLLLAREPESQALIDEHAGKTPAFLLVRGILASGEFKNLNNGIK